MNSKEALVILKAAFLQAMGFNNSSSLSVIYEEFDSQIGGLGAKATYLDLAIVFRVRANHYEFVVANNTLDTITTEYSLNKEDFELLFKLGLLDPVATVTKLIETKVLN